MHEPETAQQLMGGLRQRNQAIPIALGIANVYAPARGIDITDLQAQPFTESKSQAVEREEEHPVTEYTGGGEDPPGLLNGDDVGQALGLGRLDQAGRHPGFAQDVFVVELQPVQVQLDRTPGV